MTALLLALLLSQPAPTLEPWPLTTDEPDDCVTACEADDEDRAPLSEPECAALCDEGDEP